MPEILHCGYHTPVILAASSVILTVPSVILTAPPVIFDPTFCHLDRRERSLSSWHQAPIVPDSAPAIGPWVQAFSAFRQLALLKQVFSQSENTRTHKRALIDRKGTARDYLNSLLLLTLVCWGD